MIKPMARSSPGVHKLAFKKIATESARAISLRTRPGIYWWFRRIELSRFADNKDAFRQELSRLLSACHSDIYSAKAGYLYQLSVQEIASPLPDRKMKLLDTICSTRNARSHLASHLEVGSENFSPLYVGMSENIKVRIGQHVNYETPLFTRFDSAGIAATDLTLKIVYLESALLDQDERSEVPARALVELVEDLMTRLAPASFVRRSG